MVWLTFCANPEQPCDKRMALANRNGVKVGIWMRSRDWTLHPITKKPNAEPPRDLPLVSLLPAEAARCCDANTNAYPLSRLQLAFEAPFLTTSRNWPVVACGTTMRDWVSCGVGMEARGKFVEIHFAPEAKRTPSQREIWDLASAVDEEVQRRMGQ
jgi:hypothetical protein